VLNIYILIGNEIQGTIADKVGLSLLGLRKLLLHFKSHLHDFLSVGVFGTVLDYQRLFFEVRILG
jgi:hypothetical protein